MKTILNLGIVGLIALSMLTPDVIIVKKIIPPKETIVTPEESEVIYVEPGPYVSLIHPSDIPETKRWLYRGTDIKSHISITHGIEYDRMKLLGSNDLVRLHSYLHNGGSL
jgi:hypothetical protein